LNHTPQTIKSRSDEKTGEMRLFLKKKPTGGKNYGGCLFWLIVWPYDTTMSTAAEIEAAIEQLPSAEQAKLRDRLLERTVTTPKTGAELAALWPACFHLTTQEADEFARDLEGDRQGPPKAVTWE
jgi:hypothetical protein